MNRYEVGSLVCFGYRLSKLGYIYSVHGFSAGTGATSVAASPVPRPAEIQIVN
jgi:hypothetical protein